MSHTVKVPLSINVIIEFSDIFIVIILGQFALYADAHLEDKVKKKLNLLAMTQVRRKIVSRMSWDWGFAINKQGGCIHELKLNTDEFFFCTIPGSMNADDLDRIYSTINMNKFNELFIHIRRSYGKHGKFVLPTIIKYTPMKWNINQIITRWMVNISNYIENNFENYYLREFVSNCSRNRIVTIITTQ